MVLQLAKAAVALVREPLRLLLRALSCSGPQLGGLARLFLHVSPLLKLPPAAAAAHQPRRRPQTGTQMPNCDGLEATRRIRAMEAAAAAEEEQACQRLQGRDDSAEAADGPPGAPPAARREGGRPRRVYIVGLTANASEEDRRECFAAGMDAFLCAQPRPSTWRPGA